MGGRAGATAALLAAFVTIGPATLVGAPIGPDSDAVASTESAAQAAPGPQGPAEEPLPNAKLKRVVAMAREAPTPDHADAAFDMLFDYDYVARWSAGRLDRALDDRQRRNLLGAVRRQLLDSMGTYIGPGSDVALRVGPSAFDETPGYASVPVQASTAGAADGTGAVINLEFRMRLTRDGWKAYDVVANHASAVAFYRQYYGDLIRRHGPEVLSP